MIDDTSINLSQLRSSERYQTSRILDCERAHTASLSRVQESDGGFLCEKHRKIWPKVNQTSREAYRVLSLLSIVLVLRSVLIVLVLVLFVKQLASLLESSTNTLTILVYLTAR